jgi:cyclin-dependent kinase regulatory subunit CKS1
MMHGLRAPACHGDGKAPAATDQDGRICSCFGRRHVILPKHVAKAIPKGRLLTEHEWRSVGVQQSRGWVHYAIHRPEPHVLLFRRPLNTDPVTGLVDGKQIDPATGKVIG